MRIAVNKQLYSNLKVTPANKPPCEPTTAGLVWAHLHPVTAGLIPNVRRRRQPFLPLYLGPLTVFHYYYSRYSYIQW